MRNIVGWACVSGLTHSHAHQWKSMEHKVKSDRAIRFLHQHVLVVIHVWTQEVFKTSLHLITSISWAGFSIYLESIFYFYRFIIDQFLWFRSGKDACQCTAGAATQMHFWATSEWVHISCQHATGDIWQTACETGRMCVNIRIICSSLVWLEEFPLGWTALFWNAFERNGLHAMSWEDERGLITAWWTKTKNSVVELVFLSILSQKRGIEGPFEVWRRLSVQPNIYLDLVTSHNEAGRCCVDRDYFERMLR